MTTHDRHLAAYKRYPLDAYCTNERCPCYGEARTVDYEEENGQGSITPEECPLCGYELSLDAPKTL